MLVELQRDNLGAHTVEWANDDAAVTVLELLEGLGGGAPPAL